MARDRRSGRFPCGALHGLGPVCADPPEVAGACSRRSISLRIPTDADRLGVSGVIHAQDSGTSSPEVRTRAQPPRDRPLTGCREQHGGRLRGPCGGGRALVAAAGMDDAARRWGRRSSPRLRPRRRAGGLQLHVVDGTRRRCPARRTPGHGAAAQPDVLPGPVVALPASLRALRGSASSAESGDGPPGPSKSVFDKPVPKPADHLATGLASVCRDPEFMKVFACRKHHIITRRLLRPNSG